MKKISTFLFGLMLATTALAKEPLHLMLDWFINPNHAPIIIAQQNGYFDKHGLEVTITEPSDPALPPKLVAAEKIDLAINYQQQLHLQIDEGLPISRVSTLIATPLNCVIVDAQSGIKQVSDLKGKKIGYSIAGVDEAVLQSFLASGGLTLNDVKLVNVNFSLSPAVMSGQVDAVIGAARTVELHEMKAHNHEGRAFFLEEHGIPPFDELIFVAHNKHRHDEKIVKFNEALTEAVHFIVNHPEEAWQKYIAYKKGLDDAVNQQAWKDSLTRFALRPAALDDRRYQNYAQYLHQIGLIKKIVPVSEYAVQP